MYNIYTDDGFCRGPRRFAHLGLCAAVLLSACQRHVPPSPPAARVVALEVHPLAAGDRSGPRYPVEVAARYSNVMSFRVAGQVAERKVRLGDRVHRGEIVARLDPIDAAKQAAAARAALDAAEHRLQFARQQLDRDKAQLKQNLIAANQFEQTEDAYVAALAGRDQSADQWTVANNALRYTTLVADHDGVITAENADTGQVVAAGQAVYGLAWSGDVDVDLDAAASDLDRMTSGQAADVIFTALPGRHFTARVREIAPDADPQSRTYRVKLTLVDGGPEVRLGMTGDASLSAADRGSLAPRSASSPASDTPPPGDAPIFKIPATAIFHRGNDTAVWIIRPQDSTLELRPVTVRSYTERWVLVSDGIREGENLVIAGVHTVYAGERATPVKPLFANDASEPGSAVSP
jgi:multidrug efflux system membrane fusion protein